MPSAEMSRSPVRRHRSKSPIRDRRSPRRREREREIEKERSPRHRSSRSERSPRKENNERQKRPPEDEDYGRHRGREEKHRSKEREMEGHRSREHEKGRHRSREHEMEGHRSREHNKERRRSREHEMETHREKNGEGETERRSGRDGKEGGSLSTSRSKRKRSASPSDRERSRRTNSDSPPRGSRSRGRDEVTSPRGEEHRDENDSVAKMKAAEDALEAKKKEEPSFELSGKLAAETNRVKGVTLLFTEPTDARKPDIRWRLYVFKGGEMQQEPLYIHRQTCYLFGRERRVADVPTDHPSCSKQHAVIQFRQVEKEQLDGMLKKQVGPYLMDLGSTNGTFLNETRIEPQRYYELFEKDTIKFGNSSREYVMLHENSAE